MMPDRRSLASSEAGLVVVDSDDEVPQQPDEDDDETTSDSARRRRRLRRSGSRPDGVFSAAVTAAVMDPSQQQQPLAVASASSPITAVSAAPQQHRHHQVPQQTASTSKRHHAKHRRRPASGEVCAESERARALSVDPARMFSEHSSDANTDELSLATSSSAYFSQAGSDLYKRDDLWRPFYTYSPQYYGGLHPTSPGSMPPIDYGHRFAGSPPPSYYPTKPPTAPPSVDRHSRSLQPTMPGATGLGDLTASVDPGADVTTPRRLTGQRGRQRDLLGRRDKFRRSKSRDRGMDEQRYWVGGADPAYPPCPCCETASSSPGGPADDEDDWLRRARRMPYHEGCHHRHRRASSVDYGFSGYSTAPGDYYHQPLYHSDYRRWMPTYQTDMDYDERLQRLEADKSSLQMQVSVLTEQIDAQTEKITELEQQLHARQLLLGKAEDRLQKDLALQQELLHRSSFETQKLELMNKMSSLTLQHRSLERENVELRNRLKRAESSTVSRHTMDERGRMREKPPSVPRAAGDISTVASPHNNNVHNSLPRANSVSANGTDVDQHENRPENGDASRSARSVSYSRELSLPKTPSSSDRRRIDSLGGTLPRAAVHGCTAPPSTGSGEKRQYGRRAARGPVKQASLGALWGRVTGRFSSSAPNLVETPEVAAQSNGNESSPSPTKQRSLRRLLGKMKRSNSGNLEDVAAGAEFQRGGVRATAGPRLGYSLERAATSEDDRMCRFSEWNTAMIVGWFHEMGLSAYTEDVRRWVKSGQQLINAAPAELEKELALKHPLHLKKVILAVAAAGTSAADAPGHLDHHFVLRWLDDVGLPLYKEAFLEARVDGRVLNQLTLDDLQQLRVTNLLHALSLKRGIQVLRSNGFSVGCLRRRSTADEPRPAPPHEVALWTNHRAMEWLRQVDLAEYAPNMRGSGVHGALLVYEPRFTGELLASVLSIPASKTLLRRHLFTRFGELVGVDVLKEKRRVEDDSSVPPLRTDTRIKLQKRGQFTLRRRKGSRLDPDPDDLLCPMEATTPVDNEEGVDSRSIRERSSDV